MLSKDKIEIVKRYYYDNKMNASEIAAKLKVSPNGVYSFMIRHGLERRNLSEQNKIRFDKKPLSFKIKSKLSNKDEQLIVAGVMLYWAEGFQSDNATSVDFANSKPKMISVFMEFLREICGVDESRFRAYLYCYSNQDIEELISFWSKLTKIPKDKFSKPYIRKDFKKEKIGKMKYGLLHIRYADKKLLNKIREWITIYSGKFS